MRAFKRYTLAAFSIWGLGLLIAAVVPAEVITGARWALTDIRNTMTELDKLKIGSRILLLGSSPVVLGLSAKKIQRETSIPTFNLGAIGAVNFFAEYIETVAPAIRDGDIVVVSNPSWIRRDSSTLPQGCITEFRLTCASWHPHSLPHLIDVVRMFSGYLSVNRNIRRDALGDTISVFNRIVQGGGIATLPSEDDISEYAAMSIGSTIEMLRTKHACPVIALGPVLVSPSERGAWLVQQHAIEARLDAVSLRAFVITEGMVNIDRARFLDVYEHPSPIEREAWSDRVVHQIMGALQSTCLRN